MPWTKSDVDEFNSGLSDTQKEEWVSVANAALESCLNDGGNEDDCEAQAIRIANSQVANNCLCRYSRTEENYEVETGQYNGQEHLIVPVVMMVEGVHEGSVGPLLYLSEDLGRFPAAWNGIPVTIHHPTLDGDYVSANHPEVLERFTVGRVFNTRFENGKLRGEAWINPNRAQNLSPEVLEAVRSGDPIEVSVGVFNDEEMEEGDWRGERYRAIARNHRPDHLALLPGGRGACSWEDGCGVRANEKQKGDSNGMNDKQSQDMSISDKLKEAWQALLDANVIQVHAQGYREIMHTIQRKLDAMDSDVRIHFLKDVFDDSFVYEVRNRNESGQSRLFRREYEVQDNSEIEFMGEPEPVRQNVEYVALESQKKDETETVNEETEKGVTDMGNQNTKSPCCEEKVELLVNSDHTAFTDEDREYLNGLDEEKIQSFIQMEHGARTQNERTEESEEDEEKVQVNAEDLQNPERFLEMLPEGIQEQMRHGLKLLHNEKQQLVEKITNHGFGFTEDELKRKDIDELEKIAKGIPKVNDYSGFGNPDEAGTQVNANGQSGDDEVLMPMIDTGEKE
jgi:hypothetical protein